MLYEYLTLNTADFKTSRYAKFVTATGDFSNISIYSGGTYTPKFYKLKLFHQLNNGYLDLTDDIWKKFINYQNKTASHWCSDTSFKYYCPSQYKGKLVSSIQIEDLYKFQLYNIPTWEINEDLSYNLTLNIDNSLKVNIVPTDGCIKIFKVQFEYTIDDVTIIAPLVNASIANIYGSNSITTITLSNLPSSNKDKVLEYKITPKIGVTGGDYYDGSQDLPMEFLENYTIKGRTTISTDFDGVTFTPVLSNTSCDLINITKINNEYIITDNNNNYIDPTYNPSVDPYVFIRNGYSPQAGSIIAGTYDVIDYKPKLNTPWLEIFDTVVLNMFEQTIVEVKDSSCAELTRINLTLDFNIDTTLNMFIGVYQKGHDFYYLDPAISNTRTISLYPNIETSISIIRDGFQFVYIQTYEGYSSNTSINVGFIASVKGNLVPNGYEVSWYPANDALPETNFWYTLKTSAVPTEILYSLGPSFFGPGNVPTYDNIGYKLSQLVTSNIQYTYELTLTQSPIPYAPYIELSESYYNIPDPQNYAMLNNIIFKKQI